MSPIIIDAADGDAQSVTVDRLFSGGDMASATADSCFGGELVLAEASLPPPALAASADVAATAPRFERPNHAYSVLSDPKARARYDVGGSTRPMSAEE